MKRQIPSRAWQDSMTLGGGLIFLSLLSFASPSFYGGGALMFLVGLYFILQGRNLQKKKRASFDDWMSLKVFQSLFLTGLGVLLMIFLPASYFGMSFLVTLIGFLMFIYLKGQYAARK